MAMSAVPFALQNATHNANLFRQALSSFVPPGGGIVTLGDFNVAQTATPSMSIIVGVGRIWIPGSEAANVTGGNFSSQAMYYAENESADTRTVAAADPTNPRIDVVYAYVKDQFYSGSQNMSDYAIATGVPTPGASYPANAPSLPNNAVALAWIMVNAGASSIVTANITQLAVPYSFQHAEFTSSFNISGGNVSWDLGPFTKDLTQSYNHSFVDTVGALSGAVVFHDTAIYAIDSYSNPPASMGNFLVHQNINGAGSLAVGSTTGYAWDVSTSTVALVQSGQYVRFTCTANTGQNGVSSRVRITKLQGF